LKAGDVLNYFAGHSSFTPVNDGKSEIGIKASKYNRRREAIS